MRQMSGDTELSESQEGLPYEEQFLMRKHAWWEQFIHSGYLSRSQTPVLHRTMYLQTNEKYT